MERASPPNEGRHGARLGISGFKPYLRSAPKKLAAVRIAEGVVIPPNTTAELKRDMARLTVVHAQNSEMSGKPRDFGVAALPSWA